MRLEDKPHRINIHVFFNDGQRILLDRYFAPTLKDDWNIVRHELPLPTAQDFGTAVFRTFVIDTKIPTLVDKILPAEADAKHSFFILSDIDIQFFKKCGDIIASTLADKDIVFQSEHGHAESPVNTGFIAMKPNQTVLEFWKEVLRLADEKKEIHSDQILVNELLPSSNLKWGRLPGEIWAWSNYYFRSNRKRFANIRLHHANCTFPQPNKSSLDLKIEQLNLVAETYAKI